MTRSAVSGHQTDEHILSVARRRVPSRWRAIALGSVAAAFIFAVAFFNAISTFKNISGSQLDALAGREELIVAMNSIVIQLAPASPEVKIQGRLFQQDRRAVLMVFVPPAEVTKKFDVFLVDARGNQIKLSSLVFAENVSIRVVDISSNYLDEIAVGRLEIRDTEGRVFLHT